MAEPESEAGRSTLAPGWRILTYFGVFALLAAVGQVAISPLPRQPFGWVSILVMTLAAAAAGLIMLTRFDRLPAGAMGLHLHRRSLPELLVGTGIGGVLIAVAALLLILTGTTAMVPDEGTVPEYVILLIWTLGFFAIAAAFEELIFRGYPFQALVEWIGVWPAVLISSALFSWLHGQNPNITALAFGNIFLAGVLLAIAYLKTRSLWFATGLHLGWNWVMASLFDFPVSGITGFETPLYTAQVGGPQWWTGGAFGPEAGVAGTAVLLVGCAWLWTTRRIGEPPETRALAPLVDRRLAEGEP